MLGQNFASLEFGNCRDLPHTDASFIHECKKSIFRKKSSSFRWEISVSHTIQECENSFLSNVLSIITQVVAYGRLTTNENCKLLALKVVVVTYERSLTRGSKYSDLTGKLLVFWKTGCWGEVVATEGLTVWWNSNLSYLSQFKTYQTVVCTQRKNDGIGAWWCKKSRNQPIFKMFCTFSNWNVDHNVEEFSITWDWFFQTVNAFFT